MMKELQELKQDLKKLNSDLEKAIEQLTNKHKINLAIDIIEAKQVSGKIYYIPNIKAVIG